MIRWFVVFCLSGRKPPCVQVSPEKRLLLLCHPNSLHVWRLGAAANPLLKLAREPLHLLQLQTKEDEWIVCSTLSADGRYLAYSTETSLRVYHFQTVNSPSVVDVPPLAHPNLSG